MPRSSLCPSLFTTQGISNTRVGHTKKFDDFRLRAPWSISRLTTAAHAQTEFVERCTGASKRSFRVLDQVA